MTENFFDKPYDQWFEDALYEGLVALGIAGLKWSTRNPDILTDKSVVWAGLLWPGRKWAEELDRWRIEKAFEVAGRNCKEVPTPVELIELLPPREAPKDAKQLKAPAEKEISPDKIAEGLRKKQDLLDVLAGKKTFDSLDWTTEEAKAEVREFKQTFGEKRRKWLINNLPSEN